MRPEAIAARAVAIRARDETGVALVDESDTRECTMLGIHRVDVAQWGRDGSPRRRQTERELRALALKMGGDAIGIRNNFV